MKSHTVRVRVNSPDCLVVLETVLGCLLKKRHIKRARKHTGLENQLLPLHFRQAAVKFSLILVDLLLAWVLAPHAWENKIKSNLSCKKTLLDSS